MYQASAGLALRCAVGILDHVTHKIAQVILVRAIKSQAVWDQAMAPKKSKPLGPFRAHVEDARASARSRSRGAQGGRPPRGGARHQSTYSRGQPLIAPGQEDIPHGSGDADEKELLDHLAQVLLKNKSSAKDIVIMVQKIMKAVGRGLHGLSRAG